MQRPAGMSGGEDHGPGAPPGKGRRARYEVAPLPRPRRAVLDLLDFAAARHTIHGLLEVDVTATRKRLGGLSHPPSFTAVVVAAVAQTVRRHPEVNTRRAGRRLVRLRDVDMVVTVERTIGGTVVPAPHVMRQVDAASCGEISTDLRSAVTSEGSMPAGSAVLIMPGVVRRTGVRLAGRIPTLAARLGPAVGVSSLGMFGHHWGWGIPLSPLTLMVTVGGIVTRPAIEDHAVVEREMLPLTLTFDHSVVDGGPGARFATHLADTLASGAVLDSPDAPRHR